MTDTPASCRADLLAWAKGQSWTVEHHAKVVAENLKRIARGDEYEVKPALAVLPENVDQLAKVVGR